jgi:type II secretory pathway predicted ATPase ExeA
LDDRPPKRSLADDPQFLASLSDLDRGLAEDAGEQSPAEPPPMPPLAPRTIPRPTPAPIAAQPIATPISIAAPPPSTVSLPEPPPWLPPNAFAAINAASEALATAFEPASEPPVAPPRAAVKPRPFPAAAQTRGVTYESFYGLDGQPFAAADLRFLYHSTSHDRAVQDLLSSVASHDAVAVLTGPPDIGKTMLCRALVDQLDRRTIVSVVSDKPPASGDQLLKTLLVDFGVVSAEDAAGGLASASHDDLSRALHGFLASLSILKATALLIVDQAHKLPADVLHELRSLSGSGHPLQLVLVGEPALTRQLRSDDLRAIDERVGARVELGPLEDDEVGGYVAHRLAVAGSGERVGFSETAVRRIFALSHGVPGAINRICDGSLALAHEASASLIDDEFVENAAQQLGLTPPESRDPLRDRVMIVVLMIALVLAGAAGAGWVFREPLGRVLTHFSPGRR